MQKKHVNLMFDSILISVLLFFVVVLLVASAYGCHIQGNVAGMITSICLYGVATLAVTAILLVCCYEYWLLDDKAVVTKKLVGKQRIIPRHEIKLVEKTRVRALLNYERDAYVIYSPYGIATIFITKKNAELLREYLADYMPMAS